MSDADKLWNVSLGHGELDSKDLVVVTTIVKLPVHSQQQSKGVPVALGDAVLHAVTFFAEPLGSFEVQNKFVGDEGYDPEITLDSLGPAWREGELLVDGRAHPARMRVVGERWALVSDLPSTAVAITSERAPQPQTCSLVDVRRTLDQYA